VSNKDWQHPHDPDARITKMKDGRTRLAHKVEHAVDSYVSEPDRGKRCWEGKRTEQARVYENKRRLRGKRNQRLQRQRGELGERTVAYM
jgi:hypothetical protein